MSKNVTKKKTSKKRKSQSSRFISLSIFKNSSSLLIIAAFLLISSSLWKVHNQMKYSFYSSPIHSAQTEKRIPPTFLTIEKLSLSLPVSETVIKNNEWEIKKEGVSHLQTSAVPGENGNIILYSHNTVGLFGNLPQLTKGDKITVVTKDGGKHSYIVSSTHIVSPKDIWVIENTKLEEVTLYTCYGFADLQRFVVKAVPE